MSNLSKINLLEDSELSILIKYLIPAIFGMVSIMTAGVIDGIFIGRFVGANGLAAVNMFYPVVAIFTGISIMIGTGGSTIANIRRGAKRIDEANNVYSLTIIVLAIFSLIASSFFIINTEFIVNLIGANNEIFTHMVDYTRMISHFFVFFILLITFDMFIRGDGNPNYSVFCLVSASFINILFDYIFIAKLGFGIKGAAFATGLSQIIPFSLMLIYLLVKSKWKFVKPKFNSKLIKNILYNGSSEMINEISNGFSVFLFNFVIISTVGALGVAAFSVSQYASILAIAVFFGIAQSIQPAISHNKGKKAFNRVRNFKYMGIKFAIGFGIIIFVVLNLFGEWFTSLFSKGNVELTKLATEIIFYYSFGLMLMGVNIIVSTYFTSINYPKESIIIAVSRTVIGVGIGIFFLPKILGQIGIWLTVVFAESIGLCVSIYFLKKNGKKLRRHYSNVSNV